MEESTDEINVDTLTQGWAALAGRTPRSHANLDWAGRTDIGRTREHNEDKFDFFLPTEPAQLALRGRLFAVADGMGGHHAGQVASEAALKAVIRSYFSPDGGEDLAEALRSAVSTANTLIHHAASQFDKKAGGMGTTIVVAIVREDVLTIAHVGDSRAYLLRTGEPLRALTTDHSYVEEQVRRGLMTRAEAEISPYRNYILRSVGVERFVEIDITRVPLQVGDTILLCSDGLCGYVSAEKIATVLENNCASQSVLELIDAANDVGGKDNITALVFRVLSITPSTLRTDG